MDFNENDVYDLYHQDRQSVVFHPWGWWVFFPPHMMPPVYPPRPPRPPRPPQPPGPPPRPPQPPGPPPRPQPREYM